MTLSRPMVFMSRYNSDYTVNWERTVLDSGARKGERLVFFNPESEYHNTVVTADTGEFVGHAEAPEDLCMQVSFPDGSFAVSAKYLRYKDAP